MRIYLGTDHGGFEMKEELKKWLASDYEVVDVGAFVLDPEDDFVDYAKSMAEQMSDDDEGVGIVLCRNGVGVSVVANRFLGIRCVLGFDEGQVEKARNDDDVNCLALPADYIDLEKAKKLVEKFLETDFGGKEKFIRRIHKLETMGMQGGCCGGGCGGDCGDGCC